MLRPPLCSAVVRPFGRTTIGLSVVLVMLTACAHHPDLPTDRLHDVKELASSQSLASARQDHWPQQAWWQRYHDAQLDALMQEALADAPSMALASARLREAQGVARQAGAVQMPEVGLSGSVAEQKISYNNGNDFVPRNWNTYGSGTLNFSYEFDFWGKNRAQVAAAASRLHASEAEQADAGRVLTTAVAQAYAELARLYANRDTAAEALQIREHSVKLFQERFANGLETRGSVRQVESLQAMAAADLMAADEAITLQQHALAALLGKGPDRGLALKRPTLALDAQFGLPANAGVDLLGHRPDVTAARWQVEAAASQVGVAETLFYPNVSLSAFIGGQSLGLENLSASGSDAGSIGSAIYLPLFTGGRLQGQLDSSRAAYQQAVAAYNNTLSEALHQVADAVTSQQSLQGRLAQSKAAVAAADDAWQIANNRYRGGLATYLDVLSAEAALLQSKQVLVNLQARALSLDVALVHALGSGYATAARS